MKRIPPFWLLSFVGFIELLFAYFTWQNSPIHNLKIGTPWFLLIGGCIGLLVCGLEIHWHQVSIKKQEVYKVSVIPYLAMYLLLFAAISVDNRLMWIAVVAKASYMLTIAVVLLFLQLKRKRVFTWQELIG